MRMYNPPHPGAFIKLTYLDSLELSKAEASRRLNVRPSTLNRLINGKADVSPEMALRLEKVFGRTAESWLAMQDNYTLFHCREKIDLSGLKQIHFEKTCSIKLALLKGPGDE